LTIRRTYQDDPGFLRVKPWDYGMVAKHQDRKRGFALITLEEQYGAIH
jgi:hypothetical protein